MRERERERERERGRKGWRELTVRFALVSDILCEGNNVFFGFEKLVDVEKFPPKIFKKK